VYDLLLRSDKMGTFPILYCFIKNISRFSLRGTIFVQLSAYEKERYYSGARGDDDYDSDVLDTVLSAFSQRKPTQQENFCSV